MAKWLNFLVIGCLRRRRQLFHLMYSKYQRQRRMSLATNMESEFVAMAQQLTWILLMHILLVNLIMQHPWFQVLKAHKWVQTKFGTPIIIEEDYHLMLKTSTILLQVGQGWQQTELAVFIIPIRCSLVMELENPLMIKMDKQIWKCMQHWVHQVSQCQEWVCWGTQIPVNSWEPVEVKSKWLAKTYLSTLMKYKKLQRYLWTLRLKSIKCGHIVRLRKPKSNTKRSYLQEMEVQREDLCCQQTRWKTVWTMEQAREPQLRWLISWVEVNNIMTKCLRSNQQLREEQLRLIWRTPTSTWWSNLKSTGLKSSKFQRNSTRKLLRTCKVAVLLLDKQPMNHQRIRNVKKMKSFSGKLNLINWWKNG